MSNLQPEQRADRNGKVVTRHVRGDSRVAPTGRSVGVAAPLSAHDAGNALEQDFDTLEEYMANPSEADKEVAMSALIIEVGNDWKGARSWSKVMGENTSMTNKSIAEYENLQREFINENIGDYQQTLDNKANFNSRHSAHARAYDNGIETKFDPYFDKVWNGQIAGFGESELTAKLASSKSTLANLEAGIISPNSVIGSGYRNPKRSAREWLTSQIEKIEEDIRTHGRSNSVTVSNALYQDRKTNGSF